MNGTPKEPSVITLRDELLEGYKGGSLLNAIYDRSLAESEGNEALLSELAALHNDGLINVVATFETLKNGQGGPDFFLTRYVFEHLLPRLETPVQPIMRCVALLYSEAGQDMAAGSIFEGFFAFCEKDAARPKVALQEIEANPAAYINLLVATLVAGSSIDLLHYLAEAERLIGGERIEFKRQAVYAVGRMKWGKNMKPPESAYAVLEKAAMSESDDDVLANVVRSAFALFQSDHATEGRAIALIDSALTKGGESTLHAISMLFGLSTKEVSQKFLDMLLPYLVRIKPCNRATVGMIDMGVSHLLKSGETVKALRLLEDLLQAHPNEFSLKSFDRAARDIRMNKALLDRVTTRWLLRGERVFGEGVYTIVGSTIGPEVQPEIDTSELPSSDISTLVFVARKAVGYLFFSPICAASVIISIVRHSTDEQTTQALVELLYDPLLLNFSGKVKDYVEAQVKAEPDQRVKDALESALKSLDSYLTDLRSVGDIPELHPSEAQRTIQRRQFARSMNESLKKAESQSVFLSLITKVVLLHGRKTIGYVYSPEGQAHRTEMPLGTHSTEMEYPRLGHIDPFGLDYLLRILRAERMTG